MASLYFISHFNHPAYFNMAFDEWLFEQAIENPNNIYVRLYSWSDRGGITYGYNQQTEKAVDLTKIGETPVIRRITGGRAIYHDPSELTYAIALNDSHLGGEGVSSLAKSSKKIAEMLILFLQEAGIRSHYVRKSSSQNSQPDFFHTQPCFESFAKYELSADNRKIIASAQRRHQSFLFQHGSIKLSPPVYHAALQANIDKDKQSSVLRELTKEEFDRYRDFLKHTAENFFGLKALGLSPTEREQINIIELCENIKNNAFKKRDIIKQKSS